MTAHFETKNSDHFRRNFHKTDQGISTEYRFIGENAPCIQLHHKLYFLIDDKWYLENRDGTLSLL
jgi:hypothetical protein